MAAISRKLRSCADGKLLFWCPGCDGPHGLQVGHGPGPRWEWNQDADAPTFSPSVLVSYEHAGVEVRCHSYVRDGRIQFLDDCTHALKGQTVELPDFDTGLTT